MTKSLKRYYQKSIKNYIIWDQSKYFGTLSIKHVLIVWLKIVGLSHRSFLALAGKPAKVPEQSLVETNLICSNNLLKLLKLQLKTAKKMIILIDFWTNW